MANDKLTAVDILKLSQLRSKIAELSAQEKDLSNRCKEAMLKANQSQFGPATSALMFEKVESERRNIPWRDHCEKLAVELYGDRAAAKIKKFEDTAPRTLIITLNIKPNPAYKG